MTKRWSIYKRSKEMRKLPTGIVFYDLEIMAKTVYGEARGESHEGREAVAHVILNRVLKNNGKRFGNSIVKVCLAAWQFSTWNAGDINTRKLLQLTTIDDVVYRECIEACLTAMDSEDDPMLGSDHYHIKGINPTWADGARVAVTIGNHFFYNDIA